MAFYEAKETSEGRFILLNRPDQSMPKERMRIVGREEREAQNGSKYPVIVTQDDDGNTYNIAAWPRDVAPCINEWGGEPNDWGYVCLRPHLGRMQVAPAEDQTKPEEAIQK